MFRLFSKIPRGLDPVSSIFKLVGHVEPIVVLSCHFWALLFSFFLPHLLIFLFPFSQHVTTEGMALVKQAEDAASNKKVYSALFLITVH